MYKIKLLLLDLLRVQLTHHAASKVQRQSETYLISKSRSSRVNLVSYQLPGILSVSSSHLNGNGIPSVSSYYPNGRRERRLIHNPHTFMWLRFVGANTQNALRNIKKIHEPKKNLILNFLLEACSYPVIG